jgi:hypothetical protein
VEEGEQGAEAGGGKDDDGVCIHMLAPPCSTSLWRARELEDCEVGFGVLGSGRIRRFGLECVDLYTHMHTGLGCVDLYTHMHTGLECVDLYTHMHTGLECVDLYTHMHTGLECVDLYTHMHTGLRHSLTSNPKP